MTYLRNCIFFKDWGYVEHKLYNFEYDVDWENHVFHSIIYTCKYYTDDYLKNNVDLDHAFSLIHFNFRSIY